MIKNLRIRAQEIPEEKRKQYQEGVNLLEELMQERKVATRRITALIPYLLEPITSPVSQAFAIRAIHFGPFAQSITQEIREQARTALVEANILGPNSTFDASPFDQDHTRETQEILRRHQNLIIQDSEREQGRIVRQPGDDMPSEQPYKDEHREQALQAKTTEEILNHLWNHVTTCIQEDNKKGERGNQERYTSMTADKILDDIESVALHFPSNDPDHPARYLIEKLLRSDHSTEYAYNIFQRFTKYITKELIEKLFSACIMRYCLDSHFTITKEDGTKTTESRVKEDLIAVAHKKGVDVLGICARHNHKYFMQLTAKATGQQKQGYEIWMQKEEWHEAGVYAEELGELHEALRLYRKANADSSAARILIKLAETSFSEMQRQEYLKEASELSSKKEEPTEDGRTLIKTGSPSQQADTELKRGNPKKAIEICANNSWYSLSGGENSEDMAIRIAKEAGEEAFAIEQLEKNKKYDHAAILAMSIGDTEKAYELQRLHIQGIIGRYIEGNHQFNNIEGNFVHIIQYVTEHMADRAIPFLTELIQHCLTENYHHSHLYAAIIYKHLEKMTDQLDPEQLAQCKEARIRHYNHTFENADRNLRMWLRNEESIYPESVITFLEENGYQEEAGDIAIARDKPQRALDNYFNGNLFNKVRTFAQTLGNAQDFVRGCILSIITNPNGTPPWVHQK